MHRTITGLLKIPLLCLARISVLLEKDKYIPLVFLSCLPGPNCFTVAVTHIWDTSRLHHRQHISLVCARSAGADAELGTDQARSVCAGIPQLPLNMLVIFILLRNAAIPPVAEAMATQCFPSVGKGNGKRPGFLITWCWSQWKKFRKNSSLPLSLSFFFGNSLVQLNPWH